MAHQLRREELAGMSPEEVRQALREGRLQHLLEGKDPEPEIEAGEAPPPSADMGARGVGPQRFTHAWVKQASPTEIRDALRRGDLLPLLRGEMDHLP
jgi:hypothetical protein